MALSLAGRRILVTRPDEPGVALAERLRHEGADVVLAPAVVVEPESRAPAVCDARGRLAAFDRLLVTSANGLLGLAPERPVGAAPRAWAVGARTGSLLREHGFEVAVEVDAGGLAALVARIGAVEVVSGLRVLWPRGDRADAGPLAPLRVAGALIEALVVYRTRDGYADGLPAGVAPARLDAVVFASPSAVASLVRVDDGRTLRDGALAVAIGPTTAAALATAGWVRHAVADTTSNASLVATVVRHLVARR